MKSAICIAAAMAAAVVSSSACATSLEETCRATVRAEMKGPNCRVSNPRDKSMAVDPCGIASASTEAMTYTNRVVACVKRGGPGK
jgi:hypothetical protein